MWEAKSAVKTWLDLVIFILLLFFLLYVGWTGLADARMLRYRKHLSSQTGLTAATKSPAESDSIAALLFMKQEARQSHKVRQGNRVNLNLNV